VPSAWYLYQDVHQPETCHGNLNDYKIQEQSISMNLGRNFVVFPSQPRRKKRNMIAWQVVVVVVVVFEHE